MPFTTTPVQLQSAASITKPMTMAPLPASVVEEVQKKRRRRRRRRCRRSRKPKTPSESQAQGIPCTAQLFPEPPAAKFDASPPRPESAIARLSLTLKRGLSFHLQVPGMFDPHLSLSAHTSNETVQVGDDDDDDDDDDDEDDEDDDLEILATAREALDDLLGSDQADSDGSGE